MKMNDIKRQWDKNKDWIYGATIGGILMELSRSYTEVADAHDSTKELSARMLNVLLNNATDPNLVADLNETQTHCEDETNHYNGLSTDTMIVGGVIFAATAVKFVHTCYRYWSPTVKDQLDNDVDVEQRQGLINSNNGR